MWSYYPGVFQNVTLESILPELSPLVSQNHSRFSCLLVSPEVVLGYGIPEHPWESSPTTVRIRSYIEQYFLTKFDYCLIHIYSDGNSNIAWHNDKEALHQEIFSVSLGQRRKFRLRSMGRRKGWDTEYQLGEGDLLHMHKECQVHYQHCVPKETTVTGTRISFTFRKV